MKKAHEYTPKQHRSNNFGNNHITIASMLSADFANQTNEHFSLCLEQVDKINRLLIDKNKCDNETHYEKVVLLANACLSMAMIERRLGIFEGDNDE